VAKQIILRKKEEHRVMAGHPWVFSNEIQEIKGSPAIGEPVEVRSAGGKTVGFGLYNPHSLIAVRIFGPVEEEITESFFITRLTRALALRELLFPQSRTYRLVHGESDFLPGLVVDRYEDCVAVQTFAAGMDSRMEMICNALEQVLKPAGIVERNESSLRTLESLPLRKQVLRGHIEPITASLNGVDYRVDLLEGQKTGMFLDQRENRPAVARYCRGARVLDCFCNDGGFALSAARAGAGSVVGIDASDASLKRAGENVLLNGLAGISFQHSDVFDALKGLKTRGETFDVVILDPPSFTKNRKSVPAARKGYKELHEEALDVLKPGGILATACCSHHIRGDVFLEIVESASRKRGRRIRLLDWRGASPDHPVLPAVAETTYLKLGIFHTE
jgi:23S rRNA (cytosine1962-C5)-methyltransferase